jgi:chlorite dismutase
MFSRLFTFIGGDRGPWRVANVLRVIGETLLGTERVFVVADMAAPGPGQAWVLRGIISNERYVTREEKKQLVDTQQGLGRPESKCAALIPIRKSAEWWALTQDERRAIFEERSHHIKVGLKHLPPVARRLHHCRDLSENEPFDFLTWFEYAPSYESTFNELLSELRSSEEWNYVEREVDIRLIHDEV